MVACNMQRAREGSRVTGWEDSGAKEDRSGAENWRPRLGSIETRNNVQAEANKARSRRSHRSRRTHKAAREQTRRVGRSGCGGRAAARDATARLTAAVREEGPSGGGLGLRRAIAACGVGFGVGMRAVAVRCVREET
jgi:hypothetical protein